MGLGPGACTYTWCCAHLLSRSEFLSSRTLGSVLIGRQTIWRCETGWMAHRVGNCVHNTEAETWYASVALSAMRFAD
jgi:hypothetical protein